MRRAFAIEADKKIKLILAYPMTTRRGHNQALRLIDSLQHTADHKVSTPVKLEAAR